MHNGSLGGSEPAPVVWTGGVSRRKKEERKCTRTRSREPRTCCQRQGRFWGGTILASLQQAPDAQAQGLVHEIRAEQQGGAGGMHHGVEAGTVTIRDNGLC